MNPKLYLIIISIFFFPTLIRGQVNNTEKVQKIDSLVNTYLTKYRIQGLSVGIVQNGKEYLTKGYGYTSLDKTYPVTEQTGFVIGSITKLFTITAIMQLVEQGKIDLNKKLIDYLPDFEMKDKRYKDITILHLVTHSSGLKWDNYMDNPPNDSTALKALVYSLKTGKLNFNPGEKFSGETYSNTGYDILGYLVEHISGKPFPKYIRENIFDKVEMDNSTFNSTEVPINKKAMPHIIAGNSTEIERFNLYGEIKDKNPVLKYPDQPIISYKAYTPVGPEQDPDRNLISTADDLTKWMIHCLHIYRDSTGNFNGALKRSTLADMWSLKRAIPGKKTSIGLGWWRYTDAERGDYVSHPGRLTGFSAILIIFPEKNFGITILCNAMYADQLVWNEMPFAIMKIMTE